MDEELDALERAWKVYENSYCKYSGFAVGAVLLCTNRELFAGTNVENLSLGLTHCAERSAAVQAIAAGNRDFKCIYIVSDSKAPVSPCGACRQFLAEFNPSLTVISVNRRGQRFESSLDILLPRSREGILK